MIQYVKGDLFTYPGLDAIGHGVNCQGVMGSGIAWAFARKYPQMVSIYSAMCNRKDDSRLRPGALFEWQAPSGQWIYNMATQFWTGADARGLWLAQSLDSAFCHAIFNDLATIGIPEIGSGIGGLPQDYAHYIFEETAERHPEVDLIVVRWET